MTSSANDRELWEIVNDAMNGGDADAVVAELAAYVAQAERKARKDQIMRDSLEFSMFTGVDEAEIIDWREDSITELERESDVT